MFDQIEQLKRQFTDQYVVVDAVRPELMRFGGMTGQVKTVNMSGRALVQFDANNNIGWYDISLNFLRVVPKPEVKVEEKPAKAKSDKPQTSADNRAVAPDPVGKTQSADKAAAEKPASEKKLSVAEMLRAAKGGGAAPAKAAAPTEMPKREDAAIAATGEIPAQEKTHAAASPAPKAESAPKAEPIVEVKPAAPAGEKKKLSTAEILAALKKKA